MNGVWLRVYVRIDDCEQRFCHNSSVWHRDAGGIAILRMQGECYERANKHSDNER